MIDTDELRSRQAEFEGTRQEFKKEIKKLETERKQFIAKFKPDRLAQMALKEYVVGHKNKGTFCYWLELKLRGLGKIQGGSPADKKFGIYYGKTKSDPEVKYRWIKKFGSSKEEAFRNIKKAITDLLNVAENGDINKIRQNPLSPMFKGKILSTYFPQKQLNIFANKHLQYFLEKLSIPYEEAQDEIDKRKILIDFKNNDDVMSTWTIYEFSKFLYESFGKPSIKEDAHDALKEYLVDGNEYPNIKEVSADFIDIEINEGTSKTKTKDKIKIFGKTIDFERENRIHKLLGNRGELIVFKLEDQYLRNLGKKDLAKKIDWISRRDDSVGYDILSFEESGEKKYIEVKSTTSSPDSLATFLISSNQYEKAKKLPNYYFYIVFNAKSKSPKVWKIKNPVSYENKGLALIPINYRVTINTSVKNET